MNRPLPIVLDAAAVRRHLAGVDVLAAMRELFTRLGGGQAVQPPQVLTLFPEQRGDFITYSGVLPADEVFGVKVSPYLVTPEGGRVTAWTLLMSMRTGDPLLLCDALALTTERTAATSALAVDLLAAPEAADLVVIGSGPVALAHLRHVLPLRAWRRVRIHSPRIALRAAELRETLAGLSPEVELVTERADALPGAEVVLLCTSSGTPVLDPSELDRPALITSISTNAPRAHEVPPAALQEMEVYCDYRETTPQTAGEMVLAGQSGWSAQQVRGDLGELVLGTAPRPTGQRHAFFRSVGLGLEDVRLALAIHHAHTGESAA